MEPDAAVVVAAEGIGSLFGVVHIAEHDGRAGDADFALDVRVDLVGGTGLDNFIISIREGDADGADAVIVLRGQAAGCDALGQAVALADLDGGVVRFQESVDLLFQLDGEAVAAAEDTLEAGEVGVFEFVGTEQRLEERRHAGDDVRLLFDEQVGIGVDVELRDKDAACAADEGRMDADAKAEAMEDRHDGEHLHAVDRREAGGRDGLKAERIEVHVGEQNALGGAGGAAGIEDGGTVVGIAQILRQGKAALFAQAQELAPPHVTALFRGLGVFAAGGQCVADGEVRQELIFDFGDEELRTLVLQLGQDAGNLGIELVEREDGLGMGEVEIELDLAGGGKRMDHVADRADAIERVERAERLGAVRHADGDAVALVDAEREERAGHVVDLLQELRERRLFAHELIGVVFRELVGRGLDHLIDGFRRVVKVMRRVAVVFQPGG